MHLYLLPNISSSLLIILTIFLFHVPNSLSVDDELYLDCRQSFECSNVESIGYPFWGSNRPEYCGFPDFKLNCSGDAPSISIQEQEFRVLSINQSESSLTVARVDYWNNVCPGSLTNTTTIENSSSRVLQYASDVQQLLLFYACPPRNISLPSQLTGQFDCTINSTTDSINYYVTEDLTSFGIFNISSTFGTCNTTVTVRVSQSAASNLALNTSKENLGAAMDFGYKLKWDASNNLCEQCQGSGGQCGYNTSSREFICYCKDGPNPSNCGGSSSISLGWIIGAFVTVVLIASCICILRNTESRKRILVFFKKDERDEFDIDAFIRNHGSLSPTRYHYLDLKKMTNSFKDQIGKGGYGIVYKGKLPNGLVVAVKVLSESKGNGEDFINEVASIGSTSHVNIVTLVGFCYEGEKRALIYDYMSNGSLDKFIHYKQGSLDESCRLEWKTLSDIAVGIARGLEYLHRGCNTRILHFDIKPQNILLDKDFCPKISDFGLAKLCMTKESIVSMLGTRGTAGYIAPEVFNRNFGGVSHKSDVYSYGMLVLEMVGARKNLDSEVSHTSEMFPHYIYKDIELEKNEIIFGEITDEVESKIARKMVLISLGCIQTRPSDRPSMSKVVEMLEGPLHSLPIPPKPLLVLEEESAPMSQPSETG